MDSKASNSFTSSGGTSANTSELAIPAIVYPQTPLQLPSPSSSSSRATKPTETRRNDKTTRVSHACEECRRKKRKCDGIRPCCGHCKDALLTCRYGDGKRNLAKKYEHRKLHSLEDKVERYESLIHRLRPSVDRNTQFDIQNTLAGESLVGLSEFVVPTDSRRSSIVTKSELAGESDDSNQEVASRFRDQLAYDINTASVNNPVGFMGNSTEVSWLRHLEEELQRDVRLGQTTGSQDSSMCENDNNEQQYSSSGDIGSTYHLDDIDISLSRQHVDIYAIPDKPIADEFLDTYFRTVHPLFPVIHKPTFMQQYTMLYGPADMTRVSGKWLAMLNLVFAIGGLYCDMTGRYVGTNSSQNLIFFTRARILGALDGGVLFGIATLQDVQTMGLLGMYFLAGKQINRSWNVVGHAIRLSYGIGLHLRNVAPTLTYLQKEMRVCVWYSVSYLETTISLTTGRPSALRECDHTTPIPRPIDQDLQQDDEPDIYFNALMKLSTISADVLSKLYSARSSGFTNNWPQVQRTMESLSRNLEAWKMRLPAVINFEIPQIDQDFVSQDSSEFHRSSAATCVQSAYTVINIIVNDEEDAAQRFLSLPWWCLLYYLVSAMAILMLEMAYQISYGPDSSKYSALFEISHKALQWLRSQSRTDLASQRAYSQLSRLLGCVANRIDKTFNVINIETNEHEDYDQNQQQQQQSDKYSEIFNEHSWLS